MVVQTVRLHQVYDVESVHLAAFGVSDPKVEPLGELLRCAPVIKLQLQIILKLPYLDRSLQVARLKSTLEDKCEVILRPKLVVVAQFVVVARLGWLILSSHCRCTFKAALIDELDRKALRIASPVLVSMPCAP